MIWAACLLLATCNHALILIRHGLFWDHGGVGWASALYWSSLTLIDPIVAALLFVRPRLGIGLTAVLIATNVAHNLAIAAQHAPEGTLLARIASTPVLLSQIGFLVLVLLTARAAWRGAERASARAKSIRRAPSEVR
jgi:hypothetical protein